MSLRGRQLDARSLGTFGTDESRVEVFLRVAEHPTPNYPALILWSQAVLFEDCQHLDSPWSRRHRVGGGDGGSATSCGRCRPRERVVGVIKTADNKRWLPERLEKPAGAGAPRGFLGDLFVSPKAHGSLISSQAHRSNI